MQQIHEFAVIHPSAVLGENVSVGPFTVIGEECTIGNNCQIGPNCILEHVTLGEDNLLTGGVYLGLPPQDIHRTAQHDLIIGDRNTFREGFSAHRGLECPTRIGSDCLFMANSHVAHDCQLGDHVILANCALLAGHVEVEDRAYVSASVAVHQFSKIGTLAIVSGLSGVNQDIVPYSVATGKGKCARLAGHNVVGLKRAQIPTETRREIKNAIRLLMTSTKPLQRTLSIISEKYKSPQVQHLVEFCRQSSRGIARAEHKFAVHKNEQYTHIELNN